MACAWTRQLPKVFALLDAAVKHRTTIMQAIKHTKLHPVWKDQMVSQNPFRCALRSNEDSKIVDLAVKEAEFWWQKQVGGHSYALSIRTARDEIRGQMRRAGVRP